VQVCFQVFDPNWKQRGLTMVDGSLGSITGGVRTRFKLDLIVSTTPHMTSHFHKIFVVNVLMGVTSSNHFPI
jgi:heme/copper-type cytochrome/quinol oxidase subunit 1